MVAVPSGERRVWRFGEFFVDADSRVLLRNDEPVSIGPKAFDLLIIFLERSGEVLSKRFLLDAVWPDTIVDVNNLNQQVASLRKALDDSTYGWIETVPRVGFRFRAAETNAPARVRRSRALPLAGIAAVVLFVIVTRLVPHTTPVRSLAILPLRPEGGQDAYLGLAIADALTNRFATSKQLTVRPTSAIRRYVDRTIGPREAGKELEVDSVVAGTITRTHDTLTATIGLVRVADGRQLWSHRFTSKPDLLFSFPDEIYRSIAGEIGVTPAPLKVVYRPPAAAYEAYVEGMYAFSRRRGADFSKAESLFRTALAIDPNYAAAWAGLSDALGFQAGRDGEAEVANARALELDESLAEAHVNLAFASLISRHDFTGSRREFERALALDPNNPHAHHWYAYFFLAAGDLDRALAEIEKARAVDPSSSIIQTDIGNILFRARKYTEAIAQFQRVIKSDPSFAQAHHDLAFAYEMIGRYDDAVREMLRAAELNESFQHSAILAQVYAAAGRTDDAHHVLEASKEDDPSYICMAYAALGEKEVALDRLERAYKNHSAEVVLINANPLFDPLRHEPRFAAIARRMRP
ncbi:MAG TPA: tetratricopeptide repeat protein [Thermoanaerobaculia bacterium]|jgi:DNA-binding winged helix-turn-helix (wHTH) protein/tetratricopeptide (TPR) repeat protein/TolB-like protein